MRRDWWMPLTGVLFVIVVVVSFAIVGDGPSADDPANEVVDFYLDNNDAIWIGAVLSGIAATILLFFASYFRGVLRDASGERSILPLLAFAGLLIVAIGGALDATIQVAMTEAADDVPPESIQALQALWDNDFIPFMVGIQTFLLSSGLAIVRYGALPKWLGWIAIVLAIVAITPIGFVSFLGAAVWILIASILLTLRERSRSTGGSPGPPPVTVAP